MTTTPNLGITHLEPNEDQPDVTVDEALDALDTKITGKVAIGVDATNAATLSQATQASGSMFVITSVSPGPSAAVTINFAAFGMGLFSVQNACGQTATLKIPGQPGVAPTLNENATGIFQCDGINVARLL